MGPLELFKKEKEERIEKYSEDKRFQKISYEWLKESFQKKYEYNFTWLGIPIIQFPVDVFALQEIIWKVKPNLIIETGIAHGGSLILSASMLALLEVCGEIDRGSVIGIDIDIREHNRVEIEKHPLYKKITMIEGSSISKKVIEQVKIIAKNKNKIMVFLDSNHTHEHVLMELELYSPLVSKDSYLVVFDTIVEDFPSDLIRDRPWGKGNNPKSAVWEFLKTHQEFEIDKEIENKLLITAAPDGYLKKK